MSTQKRYPRAWRLSGTETAAPCGVEEATARRWLVVAGLVPAQVMNKRAMVSATPQHASREPHMGTVQPKMSLTRLYFLNHNPHSRHAERHAVSECTCGTHLARSLAAAIRACVRSRENRPAHSSTSQPSSK